MDNNYIFVLSQNTYDWDIDMVTTLEHKAVEYAIKERKYITVFKDGVDISEEACIYINSNHYSREHDITLCNNLGLHLIKEKLVEQQKVYLEKAKLSEEMKKKRELEELARLKQKYKNE